MSDVKTLNKRRLLLPEMEGAMARWYDRQRGTPAQLANYRRDAVRLTAGLPRGARVLEVAPGPGYLSIELARLERFAVTGLDISRTFVEISRDHAREAGVTADFQHGDVAAMPFDAESFDLIVCQAAFKNFRRPVTALNEMHRVLRMGGTAVIEDMRRDASSADIDREVRQQALGALDGFIVRRVLSRLRRRAYSCDQFEQLIRESEFHSGQIRSGGIGIEVRLTRVDPPTRKGEQS